MLRFLLVSLLLLLGFPALAAITVSVGERQTIPVGSISEPVGFEVVDDSGNPLDGVTVNFSLSDSKGDPVAEALSESTADTDSTGQVVTQVEALEVADSYTLTATLATDETEFASAFVRIVAGPPTTLTVTGGANQVIPVGQDSESIQFKLTDAFSNPVIDSAIFLTLVPQSGRTGNLTPGGGGTMTDDRGEVSTRLQATDMPGRYLIIAHSAVDSTILANAEVFVIDSIPVLPELGIGIAIDALGQSLETRAYFAGGILANSTSQRNVQRDDTDDISVNSTFQNPVNAQHDDLVFIQGLITPDSDDIGQPADILVAAKYIPFATTEPEQPLFYMLDQKGKTVEWDGNMASIAAFRRNITLSETQQVNIYSSQFLATGTLEIWFGYRLAGGTMVTNLDHPLSLTLLPPELGGGIGQALKAKGQQVEILATEAAFLTRGALVNDIVKEKVQPDEVVSIQGLIRPDSDHIGQTADIIVGIMHTPDPSLKPNKWFLYLLDNNGKPIELAETTWQGIMASEVVLKPDVTLSDTQAVNIYQSQLPTGKVEIWFGYRLENGTLVFSNANYPILVTVE